MHSLSQSVTDHLNSGTTTLATCWVIEREDGVKIGLTDHDKPLSFDGMEFSPDAGAGGRTIEKSGDLGTDNTEIITAFNSEAIDSQDLNSGRYDNAVIEIWRVNWREPKVRYLQKKGVLGEVEATGSSFMAELRGFTHYLDQTRGRVFGYECDAVLGDKRCNVDLTTFENLFVSIISQVNDSFLIGVSASTNDYKNDHFTDGILKFKSGENAGLQFHIKTAQRSGDQIMVSLWRPLSKLPMVNDLVELVAGCDKRFETCRKKFSNGLNFQGYPHMPGNDFVTSFPISGDKNDGGKR